MERRGFKILVLFYYINFVLCDIDIIDKQFAQTVPPITPPNFVAWPNGSVPFYINTGHFDNEQALIIMTSLSLIAFKTCLKFAPVMVPPTDREHVLTFENPRGTRKCEIHLHGHSKEEPHIVTLGYDCLQSPWMDRIVLRALGLPFEHNRQSRDSYIDVQFENIEQHAIPLFTKDIALPAALRALPYDVNSVMHFGDRDYSKNGHRTIIFKDRDTRQKWDGPSELDFRKIEIIYGAECRERDRQEKIELCHMYPGVPLVRKKRSVDLETTRSLRVNPDITPPPETNVPKEIQGTLKNLDIEADVQKIVEEVFKLSNKALINARGKYCNASKDVLRSAGVPVDIHGIIQLVADYAQDMVDHAVSNLTSFCAESDSIEKYQRQRCGGCQKNYYSTNIYNRYASTKHRPIILQSTKHEGGLPKRPYDRTPYYLRAQEAPKSQNDTKDAEDDSKSSKDGGERMKRSIREVTEPNREGKRRRQKSKSNENPRRYSEETEEDETQSSEEWGKRKKKRPLVDPEENHDFEGKKSRKPKNNDRERTKPREQPMKKVSVETFEEYSDDNEESEEKSDDRNDKQKKPLKETRGLNDEPSDEAPSDVESFVKKRKPVKRIPKTVTLSKENEEFYKQRKWPQGVVRYLINKTSTNFDVNDLRRRLGQVNAILSLETCVQIEEIREGDTRKHEDYLVLDNSPDFVTGRVGGRQIFGTPELLAGGQHRQHTAMMVMAMLGFYFELSRHDRDEYVKVHQRHIRADKLHHFEKIGADATLPLPYDYESATHPPWMYWRKLGKKGISTVATYKDKDPDGSIMRSLGQHKELLSESDIIKINSVYGAKCMIDPNVNEPKSDWDQK
ncbi:uncharacterized protein LOC134802324 [Cydia splendana]|uniref:uncharacterized protein LOC134802324 n=1 Tax=Cydia splendana TaxID=1100963 RepID=UPI0028F4AAAA